MSMHQEYREDQDWIEALRQAVRDEEDFQEGKWLKDNNISGSNSSGKRKHNEPTTAKTTKKPKYTAKEKRVYQAKKNEEKVDKGKAAPRQKIMHRVWGDARTSELKYLASDLSALRPDASDVASAFSTPCEP